MNWNGITLKLADDCAPDEDVLGEIEELEDEEEVVELMDDRSPPGLVLEGEIVHDIDERVPAIKDEPALRDWVENQLTPEEWTKLHLERADHVREYGLERAAMDREYRRAVL